MWRKISDIMLWRKIISYVSRLILSQVPTTHSSWFFASSPPPPFPRSSPQASWGSWEPGKISKRNCMTQHKFHIFDKLSSTIFWCLSVSKASVTPDQISTFSNKYRHTSPLLTSYHLISSSTNLYGPSTIHYRHILTQYHQVPLVIHHLEGTVQPTE